MYTCLINIQENRKRWILESTAYPAYVQNVVILVPISYPICYLFSQNTNCLPILISSLIFKTTSNCNSLDNRMVQWAYITGLSTWLQTSMLTVSPIENLNLVPESTMYIRVHVLENLYLYFKTVIIQYMYLKFCIRVSLRWVFLSLPILGQSAATFYSTTTNMLNTRSFNYTGSYAGMHLLASVEIRRRGRVPTYAGSSEDPSMWTPLLWWDRGHSTTRKFFFLGILLLLQPRQGFELARDRQMHCNVHAHEWITWSMNQYVIDLSLL